MITKIKNKIVEEFESINAKVGHCIDQRWVIHKLLPSLNPKEQLEVEPAIKQLEEDGIITTDSRASMFVMVLTQKGFDTIYQINPSEVQEKIKKIILRQFASTNAKVGHCIDERWFIHNLLPNLNPKEQAELEPAIKQLEEEEMISTDTRMNMSVVVLTEKGFDTIY